MQKKPSQKRIKHLQKIGFKHEVQKLRKDYSNTNRFKQIKHEQRSKSLKAIPSEKLKKNSGHFLQPTRIISVTASKWAIFDYYSYKYIRGYRAHDEFQLSIFSKLLVFATVNTLVTKNKIDLTRFQCIVTESALRIFKNSPNNSHKVNLKHDDILNLQDLLYLLLLSESDQIQLIIAVNMGAYLQKKRKKQYYSVYDADESMFKIHVKQFYSFVNSYCQTMKLERIKYIQYEPKLKSQKNKCSAFDIAALSIQCLKMPLFDKIMKTKQVQVQIKYINEEGTLTHRKQILNNKSVGNTFISYFNVCRNWEEKQFLDSHCSVFYEEEGLQPVILVLLGSYSPNDRQKDIQQVIEWYIKNNSKKKTNQLEPQPQQSQKFVIKPKKIQQDRLLPRFKTQLTDQLQTILEQKLITKQSPNLANYSKGSRKKLSSIIQGGNKIQRLQKSGYNLEYEKYSKIK